jgi:hypothetical protein
MVLGNSWILNPFDFKSPVIDSGTIVMLGVAILRNYENQTYSAVGGTQTAASTLLAGTPTAAGGIKKLSNAHARVWKPAPEGEKCRYIRNLIAIYPIKITLPTYLMFIQHPRIYE